MSRERFTETDRRGGEQGTSRVLMLKGVGQAWTAVCGVLVSVASCTTASPDARGELGSALKQCEVERAQCRTELVSVASTLEQCGSEPGDQGGHVARAGETPPGCMQRDGHTFVPVRASWTTPVDVDLHLVDPSGREFSWNARNRAGSSAVFEEDSTRGSGNEIWVYPRAEEGRYRVCCRLFSGHGFGSPTSVRAGVVWKGGTLGIAEVSLEREGEARVGVEFVVDNDGHVTMDTSRMGEAIAFLEEEGGCA